MVLLLNLKIIKEIKIRNYLIFFLTTIIIAITNISYPYSLVVCVADDSSYDYLFLNMHSSDGFDYQYSPPEHMCTVYSNFDGKSLTHIDYRINNNATSLNITFDVDNSLTWNHSKSSELVYINNQTVNISTLDTFNISNQQTFGNACYVRGLGTYIGDDTVSLGDEARMEWFMPKLTIEQISTCLTSTCGLVLYPGVTVNNMLSNHNSLTKPGNLYCLSDSMGKHLNSLKQPLNYFGTMNRLQSSSNPWTYGLYPNYLSAQTGKEFTAPYIIIGHIDQVGATSDQFGKSIMDGYIDGTDLENVPGDNHSLRIGKMININTTTFKVADYCSKNRQFYFKGTLNGHVNKLGVNCTADAHGFLDLSNFYESSVTLNNFRGDGICGIIPELFYNLNINSCIDKPFQNFSTVNFSFTRDIEGAINLNITPTDNPIEADYDTFILNVMPSNLSYSIFSGYVNSSTLYPFK